MVDTNALLSMALSLIADFTNVVSVPPAAVPHSRVDVQKYIIGGPTPTHVVVKGAYGTTFLVGHGLVYYYDCPGSYFNAQEGSNLERFYGITDLNSNAAVKIAENTLLKLIKRPLPAMAPRVRRPTTDRIPFFQVDWMTPTNVKPLQRLATVEIDGRDRSIVHLNLFSSAFWDPEAERKIQAKVSTPEPPTPAKRFPHPKPSPEYTSDMIGRWLRFCQKLALTPGTTTNLAGVNWQESFFYTNRYPKLVTICRITFTNNTLFECADGVPFSHFLGDACFSGRYMEKSEAEWRRCDARVNFSWQDLAASLEAMATEKLRLSHSFFSSVKPVLKFKTAEIGRTGPARALVYWHRVPAPREADSVDMDLMSTMGAEFDLHTGEVEFLALYDSRLLDAVDTALKRTP